MTRPCHYFSPSSQAMKGFSLIELMVSLTIGLIIAVAAMSAYMGASGASRVAEAQGRMNEDAQAALTILTQQLRMAGNNPGRANRTWESQRDPVYLPTPTFSVPTPTFTFSASPGTFALSAFSIRGCSGVFSNINNTATYQLDDLSCVPDTTKPDSIAVNYEADQFNAVPTTGNLPTDCLGSSLNSITATLPTVTTATVPNITTSTVSYFVADNRFYIGTSTAIVSPSLYCKGNGGNSTAQPLVENIEDMRFTYGTVTASTTDTAVITAPVAGYLDANGVETNTTLDLGNPGNPPTIPPTPPTSLAGLPSSSARWSRVVSVRICVLVRSENPVVADLASARYRKCDGTLETAPPDLRLRRAYSTTVVLRNRRS